MFPELAAPGFVALAGRVFAIKKSKETAQSFAIVFREQARDASGKSPPPSKVATEYDAVLRSRPSDASVHTNYDSARTLQRR